MPDHDAFLKTILANPVQAFPYLLYADWLEERGDERGEQLRACDGDCSRMASVLWPPERIDQNGLHSYDAASRDQLLYSGNHILLPVERPLIIVPDDRVMTWLRWERNHIVNNEFSVARFRISPADGIGSFVQLDAAWAGEWYPPLNAALPTGVILHGGGSAAEVRLSMGLAFPPIAASA